MEVCISCGYKALYTCQPCKAVFCEDHKALHERNPTIVHNFSMIRIQIDSNPTLRIVKSLIVKINEVKDYKERTVLKARSLIQKIEEYCTNCLEKAEEQVQYYMDLLNTIQNSITEQDLKIIEDQIAAPLSLPIPTPNFEEILHLHEHQLLQEAPIFSTQRLGELNSIPVHNSKTVLAKELKESFYRPENESMQEPPMRSTPERDKLNAMPVDNTKQPLLQEFKEIEYYHNNQLIQESPNCSTHKLAELNFMHVDSIKQALARDFNLLLEGHTDSVRCVAVTTDNKYIVTGSSDKTIRIWDLNDKRQECILQGHGDTVNMIVVTRDNRYIVSASSDNTIRIWDLEQRIQIGLLEGHTDEVCGVAITSDNRYIVSGSCDKTVRIWDSFNYSMYALLQGHGSPVNCVAITNDNRHAISGSQDNIVIIWSIEFKITKLF